MAGVHDSDVPIFAAVGQADYLTTCTVQEPTELPRVLHSGRVTLVRGRIL